MACNDSDNSEQHREGAAGGPPGCQLFEPLPPRTVVGVPDGPALKGELFHSTAVRHFATS